jgi:hypothetical protein
MFLRPYFCLHSELMRENNAEHNAKAQTKGAKPDAFVLPKRNRPVHTANALSAAAAGVITLSWRSS